MWRQKLAGQRLLALFGLGWAIFNYPLLTLLGNAADCFGLPAAYVYVFAAWALLIFLMGWVAEHSHRSALRNDTGRQVSPTTSGT
jgi:hypothetical protein